MIDFLRDWWRGAYFGARSSKWSQVRNAFLKKHPFCEVCGINKNLAVHHEKPFNAFPALELLESNLLVLCESAGMQCHITFGHLGNYRFYNPTVRQDVKLWREKVKSRMPNVAIHTPSFGSHYQ